MTSLEQKIIEEVAAAGGRVGPKTFVGRGHVVSWCVRRGWLEWERANPNRSAATALFITTKGHEALQQTTGSAM